MHLINEYLAQNKWQLLHSCWKIFIYAHDCKYFGIKLVILIHSMLHSYSANNVVIKCHNFLFS